MEPQAGPDVAPGVEAGAGAGSAPEDDGRLTRADESFGFGPEGSWCLSGELPPGADLGGVTIVRLLAEGGMGRVYEARQEAPRRTVAVKVIRAGLVSAAATERFLREAETLASLRHPHIAQVHTCGTAPPEHGGVPFFVMEMVDGARPITRFAATRALSIRARVALFRKVCEAVAHGHRRGVIHRDVKPGNILVDANGEPKLIDFGIALGNGVPAHDGRPAAEAGTVDDVAGTIRYMSPEQVLTPGRGPDVRSDVYALGLVLHELVTGALPYDLAGKSPAEAVRVLGSRAAPGTAAIERAASVEERRDDARDLAVVVATCLEPSAADRYATAGDLAADLGRWLEGRAILARPPTALESVRRMARRHRVAAAAVAALVVTLAAAVAGVSFLSVRLDGQRRAAEAARGVAAAEAASASRQLYASTVLLAAAARDRDNVADAAHLVARARALAGAVGGSPPIELACVAASLDDAVLVLPESGDTVTAVAWSRDGRSLVTADRLGVVRLRDLHAPAEVPSQTLASCEGGAWSVAVAPDGLSLAVGAADGSLRLHDLPSGRLAMRIEGGRQAVYAVAFSPDGRRVAAASRDRTARCFDVETGREVRVYRGHEGTVYSVAFSPDGATLATGSHDRTVRVWNADSGRLERTLQGHADRVFSVAFSPDGTTVASASEDGTVRLWSRDSGTEKTRLPHGSRVNALAFAGQGERLATVAADGVVRIWDVARGMEAGHLRGHAAAAWSVAWSADDGRLATGGADGSVRLWDPTHHPDVAAMDGRVLCSAHSPDGRTVATGLESAEVRLLDAGSLGDRGRLGPAIGRVHGVAWSPDGGLVAAACDDGALFVWDVESRERVVATQAHARRVYAVAFSPDGSRVATASEDRTVALRDPRSGAVAGPSLVHPRRVFCATFAPDGRRIVTACEDRLVRLWDGDSGAESARLVGHEGPVNWVAFSPLGDRIASASSDGTVRLWRSADGSLAHVLTGPAGQVWKVAFSPDGTRVAAAAADGTVRLWDAATGRAALTLSGHDDQVWAVGFAPDGRSLVSGSWDGTLRCWGVGAAEIIRRRAAGAP